MAEDLPAAPPYVRVGLTPIRDAVAAALARVDLTPVQRRALARSVILDAAMAIVATLPRSSSSGNITVTITAARQGPGPHDVRLTTTAMRGSQPLPGWDPDHIIRNPQLDVVNIASNTIVEDPAGRLLFDLLDIAVRLP